MISQPLFFYILPFLFLAGLCVGSFLNVVIYRLPRKEDLVWKRSHCPGCQALIPWYRNVPLLSYALLRGRCADCQTPIRLRYPAVELITALLFTAAAWQHPDFWAWPFAFFFLGALVTCTAIDLDHWILPDAITLPGILIGLASALVAPHALLQSGPMSVLELEPALLGFALESLLGIFLGGGLLYLVAWGYFAYSGKDGLGGGDIKFLAMVGAFLGAKGALITLVLSSFVGSALGLFLIAFRGKSGGTAIPFGPFLAAGAGAAFFFGTPLWQWYFS